MKRLIKITLLFLIVLSSYECAAQTRQVQDKNIPINVQIGNIYGKSKETDSKEIHHIMDDLVQNIQNRKIDVLLNYVHKDKGIYLDLKGNWNYDQLKNEVQSTDSYFELFFFDHEKLSKHKNSKNVKTIQEIIEESNGLILDMFFEDAENCEIKIRFSKKNKSENDLINPYFIKINKKWYIYRLF